MKIELIPKTSLGKWSVGLIVFFFLLLSLFYFLCASGERGGANFFSNPKLSVTALLMAFSGILAFFFGVLSVAMDKERAVLVFLAALIGLFVLIFCLAEIIFPH